MPSCPAHAAWPRQQLTVVLATQPSRILIEFPQIAVPMVASGRGVIMSNMNAKAETAPHETGDSPNQNLLEKHCEEILDQLARAARKRIRGWPMAGGDEHDIALSAMRTFIRRDKKLKIAELH